MTSDHIWYFAHDMMDPAIQRRIQMLAAAGATFTIIGFRRNDAPIRNLAGFSVIDLGRTYNGRFLHRIAQIIKHLFTLKKELRTAKAPSIIMARNLEMLALAVRARQLFSAPILIYESLDIHRLLLRRDFIGTYLRKIEGTLSRRANLLITSSPAFIREYFTPMSKVALPILLVHNRVHLAAIPTQSSPQRPEGPPWVIGWCGAIRCRQSLALLDAATRMANGAIKVQLHGKPALDQFDDFHAIIENNPHLHFAGPYQYEDLPKIYANMHFNWAIDRFEQGQNSSWLLPNRLYEGCLHAAVPIAEPQVETSRTLTEMGIGMLLKDWSADILAQQLMQLTPQAYHQYAQAVSQQPVTRWVYTDEDCKRLLHYIQNPTSISHQLEL